MINNLSEWIPELIEADQLYKFYKTSEWLTLKSKMLKKYHNECVWCREKGKISKAVEVHHIQYVKKHPALALSEYYTYKGVQYKNLVPLCHDCHDRAHQRMRHKPKPKPLTEERW